MIYTWASNRQTCYDVRAYNRTWTIWVEGFLRVQVVITGRMKARNPTRSAAQVIFGVLSTVSALL